MTTFLAGIVLGALTCLGTLLLTYDSKISLISGVAIMIVCWLGCVLVFYHDAKDIKDAKDSVGSR